MRLRTRIQAPERYEDADEYNYSTAKNTTRPAFPRLLKEQVVPFNPHVPSATFPTLDIRQAQDDSAPVRCIASYEDDMEDLVQGSYNTRVDWENSNSTTAMSPPTDLSKGPLPALGRDFIEEVRTSDEEERGDEVGRQVPHFQISKACSFVDNGDA